MCSFCLCFPRWCRRSIPRIFGVLVDGVAESREENVAVIGEQDIVSSGDKSEISASCAQCLTDSSVACSDGHVDVFDIVAFFKQCLF